MFGSRRSSDAAEKQRTLCRKAHHKSWKIESSRLAKRRVEITRLLTEFLYSLEEVQPKKNLEDK